MEALIPKPTSPWGKLKPSEDVKNVLFVALGSIVFFFGIIMLAHYENKSGKLQAPDITIPSMDFTVLNMTEPLSVKWDLLIRIYPKHPGSYVCLEGDFKVFIVYEGVTIATSSIEISYTPIRYPRFKLLTASLNASLGDMDGAIVDDIKAKGEMRFGVRLLLPDCRSETSHKMNYACDEATLRFEPGSQNSATLFGNQPNCDIFLK
ncbi:unnamed protein product [Eruca vesicaria subsp. sativa]|uniref:Transmembrane protein n=1 Tax=Eruca vesicaria subsp. sativa TaxID=29727 RepID=A0ABC8L6S6_ERUVS|nr:unnamed protein product [Eruca vesicaria subsp. sativa]